MIPIDSRQLHGLEWHQESALGRRHHLKAGDSTLAEIFFVKPFGTLAEARTAGELWTFKRSGVLTTSIGARHQGTDHDIAAYKPNWTAHKGLLRLESGEELLLRAANFWGSEWLLSNSVSEPLLRLHNRGFLKHGAQVDVESAAAKRADLGLLLCFTWYILLLHQMDATAGAGD